MPRRAVNGPCALCGTSVAKRRRAAHCTACAPAHDIPTGREADLLIVRVGAVGAAEYWLDVEVETGAGLSKLDAFFRHNWVECCGHLSMFSAAPFRYSSSPTDLPPFLGHPTSHPILTANIHTTF